MTSTPQRLREDRAGAEAENGSDFHPGITRSLDMPELHSNMETEVPAFVYESMLPGAEDLAIRILRKGARRIGIVAAHACAGVTSLSKTMAQIFVNSGFNALHIDMARHVQSSDVGLCWASSKDDPGSAVVRRPGRPAFVVARPTNITRGHFHDGAALAQRFDDLLETYEPIVVELAPLVERSRSEINPVAAAAACDSVIFLCSRAHTRRDQVETALELCRSNDVPLAGLVMNDIDQRSIRQTTTDPPHHSSREP